MICPQRAAPTPVIYPSLENNRTLFLLSPVISISPRGPSVFLFAATVRPSWLCALPCRRYFLLTSPKLTGVWFKEEKKCLRNHCCPECHVKNALISDVPNFGLPLLSLAFWSIWWLNRNKQKERNDWKMSQICETPFIKERDQALG